MNEQLTYLGSKHTTTPGQESVRSPVGTAGHDRFTPHIVFEMTLVDTETRYLTSQPMIKKRWVSNKSWQLDSTHA